MVLPTLLQSALIAVLLQGGLQIPAPVGLVSDFAHVIPADRGHFFFEHNRPATFRHPLYSLAGDWVMFKDILVRRIPW